MISTEQLFNPALAAFNLWYILMQYICKLCVSDHSSECPSFSHSHLSTFGDFVTLVQCKSVHKEQ